ncbi:hypothetical protein ABT218_33085 [Streptomyces sp. NPDC001455]|uniref:hypothetical protein n=1 Tax=unclassified Streptomyces TaxID=2593676 RepID=UPI00331C9DCB
MRQLAKGTVKTVMAAGLLATSLATAAYANAASADEQAHMTTSAASSTTLNVGTLDVPSGCTLRTIDGNRTSEANCLIPRNYRHAVLCQTPEGEVAHVIPFTKYNTVFCEMWVKAHSITEVG